MINKKWITAILAMSIMPANGLFETPAAYFAKHNLESKKKAVKKNPESLKNKVELTLAHVRHVQAAADLAKKDSHAHRNLLATAQKELLEYVKTLTQPEIAALKNRSDGNKALDYISTLYQEDVLQKMNTYASYELDLHDLSDPNYQTTLSETEKQNFIHRAEDVKDRAEKAKENLDQAKTDQEQFAQATGRQTELTAQKKEQEIQWQKNEKLMAERPEFWKKQVAKLQKLRGQNDMH